MKKRIGIIGFGAVTRLYHLPYILSNLNLELTLIVDPIASQNSNLIKEFGLPINTNIFDTVEKLKNIEIPDILVVATPPSTHYHVLLNLINFNKIILVEKPFLLNTTELNDINSKLESTNSKLFINQMRRFLPSLNFVREAIKNDLYGELKNIRIFEGYKSAWKTISNYNSLAQNQGGGNLIDTGIHIIDGVLYMTNINNFEIIKYEDDSTENTPDSEFNLILKSEGKNIDVNIYSTRNSNITPYYEFIFENIILYFYLNNHNLIYFNTQNYKNLKIEIGPNFTYEDAFSAVYNEILNENTCNISSRISNYNNSPSIKLLDKIICYNQNKSISNKTSIPNKKLLLFGGNSYVAKEFIKYAIENNYYLDIISRSPVVFNNETYDNSIRNIEWSNAITTVVNETYEFSINFAYDTSLSKTKNLQLINSIAKIVYVSKIKKNFHLSSIAVYNSLGKVKSFNIFTKISDKYSYIKKITEFEFRRIVDNHIILRCGNFVGIDSPLWVNSFMNFIIERKVFPSDCDHNSNILLTDDFSEFVLNFNSNEKTLDVISYPIKWKEYIDDLSIILGIESNYSNLNSNLSLKQNIKDLLFLFSNNPTILGYLKNSKIVEIFKNFNSVKKIFLSFRKIDNNIVNSNISINPNSASISIEIQSRWVDASVKNVINSKLYFKNPINSNKDTYALFLKRLKNKF